MKKVKVVVYGLIYDKTEIELIANLSKDLEKAIADLYPDCLARSDEEIDNKESEKQRIHFIIPSSFDSTGDLEAHFYFDQMTGPIFDVKDKKLKPAFFEAFKPLKKDLEEERITLIRICDFEFGQGIRFKEEKVIQANA